MQAQYVQQGRSIDYTPVSDTPAGTVVVQNNLVGVPANDIPANTLGALHIEGVFDIVKVNGAINPGAALYWDADGNPQGGVAGTGALTTTSSDNTFAGYAVAGAGATDETVRCMLVRAPEITNTIYQPLTAVIEDPGDTEAIPVTDSGVVVLETAGAESRTLAAPNHVGQMLLLVLSVDGGDCTVTCATGLDQTGNNTAVFGDAGDTLLLVGVDVGGQNRWRVVANDGVTLSTA